MPLMESSADLFIKCAFINKVDIFLQVSPVILKNLSAQCNS